MGHSLDHFKGMYRKIVIYLCTNCKKTWKTAEEQVTKNEFKQFWHQQEMKQLRLSVDKLNKSIAAQFIPQA